MRFNVDMVNVQFEKQLSMLSCDEELQKLYEMILDDSLNDGETSRRNRIRIIKEKIEVLNNRLSSLQDKLTDDLITPEEYREFKLRCENEIAKQNKFLAELRVFSKNIKDQIQFAYKFTKNTSKLYSDSDLEIKIKNQILVSTFPQGIIYSEKSVRTTRMNEAIRLFTFNKGGGMKNKNSGKEEDLDESSVVTLRIIETIYWE